MNKILTILVFLITVQAFAQSNKQSLVPFFQDGKYGFADTENKIIIKAKYDIAFPFYKGYDLTKVVRNNKSLIINRKGKIILKGSSDYFHKDTINGMRLLAPQKMEKITIRKFCQLDTCPEFEIIAAFDRENFFDKMNELYFVSNGEKVFLIDGKGKKRTNNNDRIRHFAYGEIEYCITEDHLNQKKGLLNENGALLLECVYDNIVYTGKGVFSIKQGSIERDFKVKTKSYTANIPNNQVKSDYRIKRKNGKSGVTNLDGEIVIPFSYDKLYPLNKDKFIFWKDYEVGILDITEKYIFSHKLPFEFSKRSNYKNFTPYTLYNKNNVFFNIGNKWCLINLNGEQVGNKYDGIHIDFQNVIENIAGVSVNNKLGIISKNGEVILAPIYKEIYCLKEDKSFLVKADRKWSWLNFKGEKIFDNFDDFGYQLKNHLLVFKEGKWFYVNNSGAAFKK